MIYLNSLNEFVGVKYIIDTKQRRAFFVKTIDMENNNVIKIALDDLDNEIFETIESVEPFRYATGDDWMTRLDPYQKIGLHYIASDLINQMKGLMK